MAKIDTLFRNKTAKNHIPLGGGGGGRVLPEKLVGGVRPTSKNLTLYMIKICIFCYPFYDLSKNQPRSTRLSKNLIAYL